MFQHKCVQFEHCLFQFSVFTGNILIWIHIPIFNQKIKGARYTRINTVYENITSDGILSAEHCKVIFSGQGTPAK